ncbi:MAG: nitroreductase family protein [Oscillospiraceae bacterium]|nr:nitroreductase family protein [Oscillospiraceae bacterium]
MLNPAFYPAMFERKSIRKYSDTPLSEEQLEQVKREIAAVTPLLPNEKFALELNTSKGDWRIFGYCENTTLGNVNLGYILQQLDLALHLQGLGRLWFGFGRKPSDITPPKGLTYAICLKIGNPAEDLTREIHEFDRKQSVTPDEHLIALLESARLAPSAMNSQPWHFTADGDNIHVWRQKLGLKKLILDRMNLVDTGIALCHAVLALQRAGKTATAKACAADTIDDMQYVCTLTVDG